mgnify:CR=1 FL=1
MMARIGYMFARNAFSFLKEKMDPRKVNGGVFLGLNGVVVKSHGGTDAEGFAAAIAVARDMARNGLIAKIEADIGHFHARHPSLDATAVDTPESESENKEA